MPKPALVTDFSANSEYLTNIVGRITILDAVKAEGGVVLMPLAWGDAVKTSRH